MKTKYLFIILLSSLSAIVKCQSTNDKLLNEIDSLGYIKPNTAIECIDQYLSINPENETLIAQKGLILHNQDKIILAKNCYYKAIYLGHESFNVYYNLEIIWYNEAIEFCNIAEDCSLEEYQEKLIKAENFFYTSYFFLEKAYKLNPNNKDLNETLSLLEQRLSLI